MTAGCSGGAKSKASLILPQAFSASASLRCTSFSTLSTLGPSEGRKEIFRRMRMIEEEMSFGYNLRELHCA